MRSNFWKKLNMLAASVLLAVANIAGASVPTSSGMSLSWVGQELNHNGRPMTILHFSSAETVDKTLDFYRDAWQQPFAEGAPPFVENDIDGWKVISRLSGHDSWVVQVRAVEGGGVEGYISDMSMSASVTIPPEVGAFPRMAGGLLVSYTSASDSQNQALTLVLKSPQSVRASAEFYVTKLMSQGYSLSTKDITSDSATLFFVGAEGKVDVAVGQAEDGGSLIFANLIETD